VSGIRNAFGGDPEYGRRLFDLALADGLDTGRYGLVADPEGENTLVIRGPNFESVPPRPYAGPADELGWAQREIDDMLLRAKP
jgi:hypothetical protein